MDPITTTTLVFATVWAVFLFWAADGFRLPEQNEIATESDARIFWLKRTCKAAFLFLFSAGSLWGLREFMEVVSGM